MEVALLIVAVGLLLFVLTRPKPSDFDVDKISVGDTKSRVEHLFGKPHSVVKPGDFCVEQWIYTIPLRLYISIHFDQDGKVSRKYRSGEI